MNLSNTLEPTTVRPTDFDQFWTKVDSELKAVPIAPEEELLPMRSTEYCTTYRVHYSGIDSYRLAGYLSVPTGVGPFPTLINISPHSSVLQVVPQGESVEKRRRYLMFSPGGRGQRNVDQPYVGEFPGLVLDGIENPRRYVLRSFVADLLRGVDYLLTRPEVDRSRIAAVSRTDRSTLVTARRPQITQLVTAPTFLYATLDRAPQTTAYPLEEINDYLRLYPDRRAQVAHTLSYFDPLCFAPGIGVPTLMWGQPESVGPLAEAMAGDVEIRALANSHYKDGLYQEQWITRQFGFIEPIVTELWR